MTNRRVEPHSHRKHNAIIETKEVCGKSTIAAIYGGRVSNDNKMHYSH